MFDAFLKTPSPPYLGREPLICIEGMKEGTP